MCPMYSEKKQHCQKGKHFISTLTYSLNGRPNLSKLWILLLFLLRTTLLRMFMSWEDSLNKITKLIAIKMKTYSNKACLPKRILHTLTSLLKKKIKIWKYIFPLIKTKIFFYEVFSSISDCMHLNQVQWIGKSTQLNCISKVCFLSCTAI